jgi:gliding motility-associated-like protein
MNLLINFIKMRKEVIIRAFNHRMALIPCGLIMFIAINVSGQGNQCVNGPVVNLSIITESTCDLSPVTINGTFGGSATSITLTENGNGSVSPTHISSSPFSFTYTPKNKDRGKSVVITVTTNNPQGSPCSEAKATSTLRIAAGLSAPVDGIITGASCQSHTGSVVLNGLPSSGTWMLTRDPGGVTSTGTGISTTVTGLFSGTYAFSVTNSSGCKSGMSADIVIPAGSGSITLVINNPPAVCSPSTVDLTAPAITSGSAPGLTLTYWTNANATIQFASPKTAGTGTYYIKGELGADCFNIKPVIVTINTMGGANAGTGGHVCSMDYKLNAALTNGCGTWSKISGPGNVVFAPDSHHPDATASVDQAGTYDFGWTVGNISCSSIDIVRVIFHQLPVVDAGTVRDTIICEGTGIQLHVSGSGFFSWTPPALLSNPNISDPVATPVTSTTFTVTLTDQFGCRNSAEIQVNVREKPVADAGPDQVLENQSSTVMDAVLYTVDDTGVWSLLTGEGDFLDPSDAKASINGLSFDRNKFLWTVKNGVCPPSSDTVMILVRDLIIPTLITPNMDGRNDYFVVGGFISKERLELIVFDRRGVQVYKNGNYDNSWNGIDINKKQLPEDTYYYILKTTNEQSIKGYIVIRR